MKVKRTKKCIICGEVFRPFRTTEKVCSMKCAIKFGKEKLKAEKIGLEHFKQARKRGSELQVLLKSTTIIVHAYVRERDKGLPCISCGTPWKSTFQAGHCFSKKQFNGIRFDLYNIHGQCEGCNMYDDGNYAEYHLRMPNRIGTDEWKSLQERARIAKRFPHSWTKSELHNIQKLIKDKREGLLF